MSLKIKIECPDYDRCYDDHEGLPITDCIKCLRKFILENEDYGDEIVIRRKEKENTKSSRVLVENIEVKMSDKGRKALTKRCLKELRKYEKNRRM